MLSGFNHLTLAVTDVPRSVSFYHDLLRLQLDATWDNGAYLSLPGLWLCLSLDPLRSTAPAVVTPTMPSLSMLLISLPWSNTCVLPGYRNGETTAAKAHRFIFSIPTAISWRFMSAIWPRGCKPVAPSPMLE